MNLKAAQAKAKELGIPITSKTKAELVALIEEKQGFPIEEPKVEEIELIPQQTLEADLINKPISSLLSNDTHAYHSIDAVEELNESVIDNGVETQIEDNPSEITTTVIEGHQIPDSNVEEIKTSIEETTETPVIVESQISTDKKPLSPEAKKWLDYFNLQRGKKTIEEYLVAFDIQYRGTFKFQKLLNEIKVFYDLPIIY